MISLKQNVAYSRAIIFSILQLRVLTEVVCENIFSIIENRGLRFKFINKIVLDEYVKHVLSVSLSLRRERH